MPDLTPRRSRVQAASAVVIATLVWLAASVGTIGPVAASDPTATPTPTLTATATPTPTPTPIATVTFYGRGYGHGIGMSQYGARGRALAGQTAPQILAHYYVGTTPGILPTSTAIRVLVVNGFKPTTAYPARVIAHGGTWTVDGLTGTWPAEASATLVRTSTPTAGWRLDIRSRAGTVLHSAASPSSVRIRPAGSTTTLQVWFDPSYYDTFRGVVRVIGSTSGTFSAVNETSLESYLRGVVPVEMPSTWPAAALKAQAIAARSYAAAHLHPTSGTYDMTDSSQAYRGVLAEKSTTTAAVTATAGQVLRSGGHVITAMYHSADGGATENNENVYVSATGVVVNPPVAYLRGEPDRTATGASYDAASPHATWKTATYTYAQLSAVFASDPRTAVGTLAGIAFTKRGVSGRLIAVRLTGSLGVKTVSGDIFRSVFNTYTPAADPYMWSTLVATSPIP